MVLCTVIYNTCLKYCNLGINTRFQDVLHEIFAGILDELDEEELQPRRIPRIVPRDRRDPMAYLTEHEFVQRFRLSKSTVRDLLEEIRPRLPIVNNGRGKFIS